MTMRIGVHVSIAGKIYEALERAKALGCNTIQIFSRNPRGWQVQGFDKSDLSRFSELKAKYGIAPIAVHIPYIINLATPDDRLYRRSIEAYIDDVKRADLLGAEYFVTHLGSHKGSGEDSGIKRFSGALVQILKKAKPKTTILLENTAGSGDSIGYKFEHIQRIIDSIGNSKKIGVSLDTAHMFEAGYDLKTKIGFRETFSRFDELIGLDKIKVIHFNDSLSLLGSHVDRHQHLGKGEIGLQALGRVINHPALKDAAFIMETPKESDKDDKRNIAIARKMCKKR
ncbi:MAG: deoxyribonuclease IV [Candidatus Omnitrophica bacterium]|nr:deoxyribonuclease IV [Candidatus Omnitrophota bacterium]